MIGARGLAVLLVFAVAAGCRSDDQRQESYRNLNVYGSADQEGVVSEVGTLPYKKQRWSHRWAQYPIRRLSLGRENLYIETPDNKVLCANRFDGITKWIFDIPSKAPLDWTPVEPGEVYEEIRTLSQQHAAQARVVEDVIKAEGHGQKARDAQIEKNRIGQLLNAAQRGDNVYMVSRQVVYCVDRQKGSFLWQRPLGFAPSAKGFATRESLFIPAGDRPQVWRLEVEKRGEPLQSYAANVGTGDRTILNAPIVDHRHLYFVCADGNVYCYNVATGNLQWTYQATGKLAADPALYEVKEKFKDSAGRDSVRTKRYFLCGGLDYAVYCLDPDCGLLIWKYETGGFLRSPMVVRGATVYAKSDDGALFALELDPQHKNAKTGAPEGVRRFGSMRWKLPAGERFLVKGGSDRVLVLGPKSEIYQYVETTGEVHGRFQLNWITHVPTNPWDSILYVATDDGAVFALEEAGD
jgi:hypothetical protein